LEAATWLAALREGHAYITNGPLLELETERAGLGETLKVTSPTRITVVGRGLGRVNFGALELVYNGKVVHRVKATAENGYFSAALRHALQVDEPGWFAMRIPQNVGTSELGYPLFAHTSPIYIELAGRTIFRKDTAQALIEEMRDSMKTIEAKAVFGGDDERQRVLQVYRDAIRRLETRLQSAGNSLR
jgi:hypothetical protein